MLFDVVNFSLNFGLFSVIGSPLQPFVQHIQLVTLRVTNVVEHL